MKKKLLSLVLAGAMVASTSVSAFADTVPSEKYEASNGVNYNVTGEKDADIKIEGRIADTNNTIAPSTISVTVPTTAKFTVNNEGKLIGSNINITSQGDTEVQVIAYKFADPTGATDINAVSLSDLNDENQKSGSDLSNVDRSKVYLKLVGDAGSVSLRSVSSSSSSNGIYELEGNNEAPNTVLGTVKNGKNLELSLDGSAVTVGNKLSNPLSDNFTLTLKLKKVGS